MKEIVIRKMVNNIKIILLIFRGMWKREIFGVDEIKFFWCIGRCFVYILFCF